MRFMKGNSLIGARRECFTLQQVSAKKLPERAPRRVPLGQERAPEEIYHFLLPDSGMADYKDKVIRSIAPKEVQHMQVWRKDFITPLAVGEAELLCKMSGIIDQLWQEHVKFRQELRDKTTDVINIFGQPECARRIML